MKKARPFVHGDVLDLGCGPAVMLELCRDRTKSYCGVDRSAATIEKLRASHPESSFHQRDLDGEDLNLARQFDVVLMLALVEHIFNHKYLFEQAIRHLKPDGRIVITTPTYFGNDVVHRLGAAVGLFAKSAADDHIVIYNKQRFRILANELNLRLLHFKLFEFGCNQLAVLARSYS